MKSTLHTSNTIVLFLFLFVFISKTYAQVPNSQDLSKLSYAALDSLMFIEYNNNAYDNAILYLQIGRDKAKLEFGEMDSLFASYIANIGFLYKKIHNYEKAEPLLLQAKNILAKVLGEQHPDFATSLGNLAGLYSEMGLYEKAEPLYLQTINIQAKVLGESHPSYANSLDNLAGLYSEMGLYEKAEPLYLQAINIKAKVLGEEHPNFAQSLNNLAGLYYGMNFYEKAEPLYLQTINIAGKVLGEQHPYYANSLNNLAGVYHKMGRYEKAESLYLQAKNIRAKVLGEEHPNFANSLNNLGLLYRDMAQYKKSEAMFLQAKKIWGDVLGYQHPTFALNLNNMALLYHDMGKLDTALFFSQQSILAYRLEIDSNFTDVQDWGNLDQLKYASANVNNSIKTLLYVLYSQYKKTGDKSKLELRYQVVQAAMRLNERIRNDFGNEGDKLRILETANHFVLEAIKTGLNLQPSNYLSDAFAFAEMNKGVLLMDAAKTSNAYKFGDLPDSLVAQEKKLQKKQADLEANLLGNRPKTEKDSLLNILNKTNQEITNFTKNLKAKYPKYAALKYENKSATAKEIQALLPDKTALLEYVIGDSVVYIFYVDKTIIELVPLYIGTKDLAAKIKDFHSTLSNYVLATKESAISYQKYTENAFWFYDNLVAPALKSAKNINKLLIVSDGELGHLPFEAFLTKAAPQKETDYHKLDYLSNDYKISYNYSATIWKAQLHANKTAKKATKNKNNGQILAMASNYDINTKTNWRLPSDLRLREGLVALPAAKNEVDILASKFNGLFAFDKESSEKNFKVKAGDYAIIHLAMHGLLDNKNPILSSLAFTEDGDSLENNFLHAYEISKMKLNADLVVLSACETGYGRFEKGNGIASLAQAFSYAGAPALIVSLWQVNDYATSEIMKNLYQNLADGMEKDEALQQAKIKYMKEAEGIAAHPAFWSPFILMGNTDAIYLKTKGGYFWWLIGGGIVALGLGILYKLKIEN